MNRPIHRAHVGAAITHIGDCYVRAEIDYLDSVTDFREYLPAQNEGQLVMLDEITPSLLWTAFHDFAGKAASLARGFAKIAGLCFKMQR